ncbi:MAG: prepilin-type N-terminal cleavage/methylation domain-containing protein [Deltaproteobacteria bacterium]|nr:prepilin-type N-terminal cleavage/methylation domain-containing protein [Deltaproteobacteria bacterium]
MAAATRGFTLIELLIVLTLIGIVAGIAAPLYHKSVVSAREAALKENLYQMREAIDKYYADAGEYPQGLISLVEKKYIRSVPADPFTRSKDTWVEVPAEGETGVFDVKSGSALTGNNGTPYNEW